MGPFDLFTASTAHGNLNGALHQCDDELALIFGGSAHVSLGIGGSASGFGGGGDCLVAQTVSAECRLGLGRSDRRQSNAAQSNGGILADVARQCKLYSRTSTGIHRRTPLECEIGAAAALGRNLHFNFGYKFVVS